MTKEQFVLILWALAAGLLAAGVGAVALRRLLLEALDRRRAAQAAPTRAVVSRYEVEQRKIDASIRGCDTVQIGPIAVEQPEQPAHQPRHAATESGR